MSETDCQVDPIRCPYCVQDNEFKIMLDLTGGTGGIFYCASCRHLVRTGVPGFQCLCLACKSLRGPTALVQTGGIVAPAGNKNPKEQQNRRGVVARSSAG